MKKQLSNALTQSLKSTHMKLKILVVTLSVGIFFSCQDKQKNSPEMESPQKSKYFDYSNSDDQQTGGIKMIPITTPQGTFNVWTKRMGTIQK